MASTNNRTSLDATFKRVLADDINMLIPESAVMTKLFPKINKQDGREYLEPVALTHEHGVSYNAGDGVTPLESSVAAVYGEAKVTSSAVILRTRFGQEAVNRMQKDETTFLKLGGFRAKIMKESIVKRAELAMLYGRTGLAALSAVGTPSGGVLTVTVSDATWSPAIWGGMEGALVEIRVGATGHAGHTTNVLSVTSVAPDTKQITVTGNQTELGTVAAGDSIYFRGSYTADMAGLDKIITNTGSLFNIDASVYQLWKSSQYPITGSLTFGRILKAAAQPVARGGLDGDAVCLVPPRAFEQLNEDYSAYRQTDSSYKAGKGENGVEALDFHYQAGRIQIMPAPYVKEGESFLFPREEIIRVGAKDFSFGTDLNGDGSDVQYFHMIESVAAWEMRAQYDFCIFARSPAKMCKITGITYS